MSVFNSYNKSKHIFGATVDFDLFLTSSTAIIDYNRKRKYPWGDNSLYVARNDMGIRNISKGIF